MSRQKKERIIKESKEISDILMTNDNFFKIMIEFFVREHKVILKDVVRDSRGKEVPGIFDPNTNNIELCIGEDEQDPSRRYTIIHEFTHWYETYYNMAWPEELVQEISQRIYDKLYVPKYLRK